MNGVKRESTRSKSDRFFIIFTIKTLNHKNMLYLCKEYNINKNNVLTKKAAARNK